MRRSTRRVVGTILFLIALACAIPAAVAATVTGGCQVQGTSTSGGTIDLTTAKEWHLKKDDIAGGSGTSPVDQTAASVGAYALGLQLPVASGSGNGGKSGAVQGVSVAAYSALGQRFVVAGKSDSCSGQVVIIIDDVNPALTALGGGGIGALVLGALVLLGTMFLGGGILSRIVGLVFGALAGLGLALALEQFGILDPTTFIGLVIAIVGAVLGLILPGTFHKGASNDAGAAGAPA
jgi:hypothetical protein